MAIILKKQRDGETWRPYWYGEYRESGKRKVVNLGVKWKGTPPTELSGTGDAAFERSRTTADKAFESFVEQASHKGRVEHLTERLIESKTGRPVEYARIDALPERWRNMARQTPPTERHLAACDAHFKRFVDFMRARNPKNVKLYEVTPEDTATFISDIRAKLAPKTARDAVKLLNKAFTRFLPIGTPSPFTGLVGQRQANGSETIHRKPFTPEELRVVLDTARCEDDFIFPLIVCAACTGMRRGDVCRLKWRDVDLTENMLAVKTSKTGENVEIPIFDPLREVFTAQKGNGKDFVFPSAARMLADNPDGLTWRFKKIVAIALSPAPTQEPPPPLPPAEIESEGIAAIENLPDGNRRDRMLDTFRLYLTGQSMRVIVRETGRCKATVSNDLHAIEDLIGKPFMRVQNKSIKRLVHAATRTAREHGQRAASVRDWHTLRTTFITLALTANVPLELVQRITGHRTVNVVLKHYFRPDREQFRAALTKALPGIITTASTPAKPAKLAPSEELSALAGKLVNGTATAHDKARIRTLAAKV